MRPILHESVCVKGERVAMRAPRPVDGGGAAGVVGRVGQDETGHARGAK